MRTVVYEKERKLLRTGGPPAPSREVVGGWPNGPRGSEDCRGFRVVGTALASGLAERRIGGIESQGSSWPPVTSEHETEAAIGDNLAERPTKGRLPNGPMDLSPCCGGNRQDIRRRIPFGACMEDTSRTRLDMSETRASSTGTQRSGHRALAQTRVAANKKRAKRDRNPLIFSDESGFMLQPVRRRTWAPSGQTPIQYSWDRHDRLSAIALIGVSPIRQRLSLYFQLLSENVDATSTIWLLHQLHRHYRCKVIVVWDRWSVHRSAAAYFEAHHPDWFTFEWLPAYAPDLNPVEQCWNHTKYSDLANFIPDDLDDLEAAVNNSIRSQSEDQILLRSYFAYCELKL